ncbi:MAG: radical SAM protein [Thermodesulfobacteriota bacterium]
MADNSWDPGSFGLNRKYTASKSRRASTSRRRSADKAALVTPCLPHLPFHPACLLGYGAAVLAQRYDVDIIDLNSELHFKEREKLLAILHTMDQDSILSDAVLLRQFYLVIEGHIDGLYDAVPWDRYSRVYLTSPSWFPTVPTEAILRLTRAVSRRSPETEIFYFGNSLGSWTNEEELRRNRVQPVHLNNVLAAYSAPYPVLYDLLPTPIYDHREKYLFDLLPFTLKHGCSWGRCRFCSFCIGWNSGYVERSPEIAAQELEILIDRYDPRMLVCRDHSLNGRNLEEFCGRAEGLRKPWCGQSRADLSEKKIRALRKAGCRMIFFGLESGSDRTLRAVGKGLTVKQMSDFTRALYANGILPSPSLIVGSPGEERPDFEKTIQFLVNHRPYLEVVNAYPFLPTPASDFSSREEQPHRDTTIRLFELISTCEDLGLKVCLGEQSIEYFLFNRLDADHDVA